MIGLVLRGWRRLPEWVRILAVVLLVAALILIWRGTWPQDELTGGVSMNVPPFNQGDYTETVAVIGGQKKSVKSSGCGAACVAVVGQYLTGDEDWDPQSLFQWAFDNGYYFGDGLSHECLREMAKLFGLSARWTDKDAVKRSLREMKPVVAHMRNGFFSNSSGHYIVLTGETEDGKVIVHDPGSRARSGKAYEWDFLVGETKGEDPFMVVR